MEGTRHCSWFKCVYQLTGIIDIFKKIFTRVTYFQIAALKMHCQKCESYAL